MNAATAPSASHTASATRLRWDVVERRCHDLGADTDTERGDLLGVNRNTILRWRHGWTGVNLSTALHVAKVLSVRLDQLVEVG